MPIPQNADWKAMFHFPSLSFELGKLRGEKAISDQKLYGHAVYMFFRSFPLTFQSKKKGRGWSQQRRSQCVFYNIVKSPGLDIVTLLHMYIHKPPRFLIHFIIILE